MDDYKTIAQKARDNFEVKRSKFIGTIAPVTTEDEAQSFIEDIKEEHKEATHNVYAYVVQKDNRIRYSDDGEPHGTAGLPTLSVIEGAELVDVCIVATRYFGGTLLGKGGLVRAYTQTAQIAIAAAKIVEVKSLIDIVFQIDYSLLDQAKFILEQRGGVEKDIQYTDTVLITATFLEGSEEPFINALKELCQGQEQMIVSDPYFGTLKVN